MMKIDKEYTPGPWRVMNDPHSRTLAVRDDAGVIAQIYTNRKNYNAPGDPDANARLISAAPELVEALISDARTAARSSGSLLPNNIDLAEYVNSQWVNYLTTTARAALAKAGVLKT